MTEKLRLKRHKIRLKCFVWLEVAVVSFCQIWVCKRQQLDQQRLFKSNYQIKNSDQKIKSASKFFESDRIVATKLIKTCLNLPINGIFGQIMSKISIFMLIDKYF